MGVCALVNELNRLRKSSGDSIDSDKSFDSFKNYMHIRRNVEDDLKIILRNTNESGRKTLVLLCGSAGDGKSHMLSYLKNSDSEHLLENFRIHNDATESSAPNKTAIDTLNEVLEDFSDAKINNPGTNLILAINLGVLNNFIESEYGQRFSVLRTYVQEHYILSTKVVDNTYDENSPIQHVSFADYQMYTLTENGADSQYIKSILERIFSADCNNPFYDAFCKSCEHCSLQTKCPVRYNFSFLQNSLVQKYITKLLIMTIIKKKEILTTREILNYFYDITVPQDFNYSELGNLLSDDDGMLKKFLRGMTPNLMFEQDGVSSLMNHVRENDPVLYRDEISDDYAVEYYVSTDVSKAIKGAIGKTAYQDYVLQPNVLKIINSDKDIKGIMFSCLIRLRAMQDNILNDPVYDEFVKVLFYFNAGRKNKKLGELYTTVKNALLQWCGTDGEGHACLDQSNYKYSLFENIQFDSDLSCIPEKTDSDELHRFIPELKVGYKDKNGKSITPLDIDFPLYRMINRLNHGYVHTVNDENNHADFISFIDRMLRAGNSIREVYIVARDGKRSVLKRTDFGYDFEVMK